MYSKWQLAFKYLRYYFTASNGKGHGIHSPFIFQFVTKILNDKLHYTDYDNVEELRKLLLNDHTIIKIEDFGAGSSVNKSCDRTIGTITENSAKPAKQGQLLYRMVKTFQPNSILELGTSLGLTTSYLSLANPQANIYTMEGSDEVALKALSNFKKLGLKNISMIRGNFDETFVPLINSQSSIDFCFVDGNHRFEPTLRYFNALLPLVQNDSILIFDDIHWSREMEQAWDTIKSNPAVRCSIDLFSIGILFFREEFREKQEFTIRF
jgi:predicted O-methyltransferase YrrM